MTRFEMTRVIGMRALQLSEGHQSDVVLNDPNLRYDYTYVAACELRDGQLDMKVERENGDVFHVRDLQPPLDLATLIAVRDGSDVAHHAGGSSLSTLLSSIDPRNSTLSP